MTTLKSGHQVWNSFTHWCITVAGHTITTGPRPTYLKSHAPQSTITIGPRLTYLKPHVSQSTHNHQWTSAHIYEIIRITENTQSPPDLCPCIICITENTISIISCASHKTQSPPELCPHIICIAENTITTVTMSTCLKLYASQKTYDHHQT